MRAEFAEDGSSAGFVSWNWVPGTFLLAVGLLILGLMAAHSLPWPAGAVGGIFAVAGFLTLGSPSASRFDRRTGTYRYASWYAFIPVKGAGPLSEIECVLLSVRENRARRSAPTRTKGVLVVLRGRTLPLLHAADDLSLAGGLKVEEIAERLSELVGCPLRRVEGFGYSLKRPPV